MGLNTDKTSKVFFVLIWSKARTSSNTAVFASVPVLAWNAVIYQQLIIANCNGVTTLDTSGFISCHQEHLPAPLVMLSNPVYRAFNAVFGKVGRTASPDVVLQLVKSKCLPALCYGVDVCPVKRSQTASLQYVVHNVSAKYLTLNQQRLCDIVWANSSG